MDSMITISNVKENVLEFNVEIKGVDTSDMSVHFIIQANSMDIGFNATHLSGDKWEVVIPPLPMLERTAYPFRMQVDCDGYHFEPLQGTINVVGSHDIYVSTPSHQTIAPKKIEVARSPTVVASTTEPHITLESKLPTTKRIGPRLTKVNNKPIDLGVLKKVKKGTQQKTISEQRKTEDIVKRILTESVNVPTIYKTKPKPKPKPKSTKVSKKIDKTVKERDTTIDDNIKRLLDTIEAKPEEYQPTVNKLKKL